MEEMDRVLLTAEECLARVQEERPELVWLKGIYDRFRKKYRLSGKQEADALIFENSMPIFLAQSAMRVSMYEKVRFGYPEIGKTSISGSHFSVL